MVRLLFYVVAACLVCKLATGRWPWDFLRAGSTRARAAERARKLLGVRTGASRTEIIEAHRRLVAMVHPDRGGTNEQVHEANAARDLLIDQLPET